MTLREQPISVRLVGLRVSTRARLYRGGVDLRPAPIPAPALSTIAGGQPPSLASPAPLQ